MRTLAVIPARLAAARLPNKPLADLCGRPVIEWVHRRTVAAQAFDEVIVATPDQEIVEVVERFGGRAVVTSNEHHTGTDRVAEVADRVHGFDVIANVQGDQPFVTSELLHALLEPYARGDTPAMVTIGAPLYPEGHQDPHTVKVLVDRHGDAIYFSRSAVPHGWRPGADVPVFHHLGLYAFTPEFLREYAALTPTPLEELERLEQLRALEHGTSIRVSTVPRGRLLEVNTPEDLAAARAAMSEEAENG